MTTMFKNLFIVTILQACFVFTGFSQTITKYAFAASSGTFTNLSGGASPALTSGTTNEGYLNAIPIGFDFWYMGVRYTTVSASTNGWITPGGNITAATPANSLTSNGAPRPIFAPLWDLICQRRQGSVSTSGVG